MTSVVKQIDVAVPVDAAYNQWTQFETFPEFMEGVEKVVQQDDRHLVWKAKVAGKDMEWSAEITEQIPDVRVAWMSTGGARHAGAVDFHKIDEGSTRVVLLMETKPQGAVEAVGDAVGLLGRRVQSDLERFKDYIEKRGAPTGAWRGEVPREG